MTRVRPVTRVFIVAAFALAAVYGVLLTTTGVQGEGDKSMIVRVPDTDQDGCHDWEEQGPTPSKGGKRDPTLFWDFFDTPTPATLPDGTWGYARDGAIFGSDIAAVVGRFGTSGWAAAPKEDALAAALEPPSNATGYHPAFDRTAGASPWASGPPDGSIFGQDISGLVQQFGHSCEGPYEAKADLSNCEYVKELGEEEEEVELQAGESFVECFIHRNPETGEAIEVIEVETTAGGVETHGDPPPGMSEPSSRTHTGVKWYRCRAEKKVESVLFNTRLAFVKLFLDWKAGTDPFSPWWRVVAPLDYWKEAGAQTPISITNYNDDIDVWYPSFPHILKARTWTRFQEAWTIPLPKLFAPRWEISYSKDFQMFVRITSWLDLYGNAQCSTRGWIP